jgi:hypothetical protein
MAQRGRRCSEGCSGLSYRLDEGLSKMMRFHSPKRSMEGPERERERDRERKRDRDREIVKGGCRSRGRSTLTGLGM